MALKEVCRYCDELTIPKRIKGFYLGSDEQVNLWECRQCLALWSSKTKR
jgi:hypothetical protein